MKNFKSLLAAVLIAVSSSASAQFIQNGNKNNSNSYNAGWNEFTFDLGYGNSYYTEDGDYNEDIGLFAFNYAHGIHLTRTNGLTLRPSVGVLVGYLSEDDYYYNKDMTTVFVSLTPKVDFGYHFIFPNSSISIFPYIGLTTRINTWGQIDIDGDTYDLFDEDEGDANRFQVGGRIGCDAHFNKFVLGLTYEHDFSNFSDDVRIWHLNLKLGWCF